MTVLLTSHLAHQSKGKTLFLFFLVNANCGSRFCDVLLPNLADVLLPNLVDVPADFRGEGFVSGYAGIAFSF